MESRRKVLLAAIIFTAVCYKVTAQDARLLDALNPTDVVDDQYNGCRKEAVKKFIQSDLLKQELNRSEGFQKAWNKSNECLKQIPGGRKEHTSALSIYAHGDHDFLQTLNKAIETMGGNVSIYENHFHFKSLHFLLMDSMKLLKPKECKTFYVFQDGQSQPRSKKGSTVRFTSFTSAYSNFEEIKRSEDLADNIVLNLTSCFFVNLKDYVCDQTQDTILLSPAEVFTVEETETKTTDDDEEYVEIVLKQSGLKSFHNCYIFSRDSGEQETVTPVPEKDRVPGGQQTVTAVTERDRDSGGQETVTAVTEKDRSPAVVSTLWLVSVLVASSFFYLAL
ncbi:ecto-ADP-ribosyltransferase 5-like isoform X3 [Archocentrus centrarchus]|uniref:ecto-ADP-ribosyltransferase 5-like isoform X2 n=1 Tax=Archocentrus centrarchus TaxID=63155 RepID=UPI0011EA17E5|nr:ecto-ADP-ribosyltransferase 5-like isoform X2 [Archocentrus centrarchus]XP_030593416.1 ecto-ADP-ribosyltransferase 5-like isoform X3 [Archocentrus centrarchus]